MDLSVNKTMIVHRTILVFLNDVEIHVEHAHQTHNALSPTTDLNVYAHRELKEIHTPVVENQ